MPVGVLVGGEGATALTAAEALLQQSRQQSVRHFGTSKKLGVEGEVRLGGAPLGLAPSQTLPSPSDK